MLPNLSDIKKYCDFKLVLSKHISGEVLRSFLSFTFVFTVDNC